MHNCVLCAIVCYGYACCTDDSNDNGFICIALLKTVAKAADIPVSSPLRLNLHWNR